MAALKYVIYVGFGLFVMLTIYSVSTEKPRQYRARIVEDVSRAQTVTDINPQMEEQTTAAAPAPPTLDQGKERTVLRSREKPSVATASTSNSVVVAFSNNDAGGKIVLTINKCEKSTGSIAYTTAQDGKIDFGCWANDELYILVNWDKAGLNNYTYDRFYEIKANERLRPKHLFDALKEANAAPNIASSKDSASKK